MLIWANMQKSVCARWPKSSRRILLISCLLGFVLTVLSVPFYRFFVGYPWTFEYRIHVFRDEGQPVEFAAAGLPLRYFHIRTQADFGSHEWFAAGHVAKIVERTDVRSGVELLPFLFDATVLSLLSWILLSGAKRILTLKLCR